MTDPSRGPNVELLGVPGGRARLATPCLVLDADALEANVRDMAAWARARGIALRPHAKTHKSVEIARRQVAAGALGIGTATLAEAEILAGAGIPGVLLTTPIAPAKFPRLARVAARAHDLAVVADDPEYVASLAAHLEEAGGQLTVLVDLDVGQERTGVRGADAAVALARTVEAAGTLTFGGVQAYYGHLQHVGDHDERAWRVRRQLGGLREALAALDAAGLAAPVVTGGGTGTHAIDAEAGLFTELQPGSYVFNDVQYADVALRADDPRPFRDALFVRTSVVSANVPAQATTDAGLKRFATEGPAPRLVHGAPEGATYAFAGDEHGRITFAGDGHRLPVGAAVECLTPHCDPTVNLYARYHVVRGDTLVDIWPVDAQAAE